VSRASRLGAKKRRRSIRGIWGKNRAGGWILISGYNYKTRAQGGEGKTREVRINYTSEQFDKIKKCLQVWESRLSLQVFYVDASEKTIEKKIHLARFTPNAAMIGGRWGNIIA
jgi:hypothetical protein